MSSPRAKEADVRRLIESLQERTIARAELAELQDALREDPEARRLYRDFFCTEALLRWMLQSAPRDSSPSGSATLQSQPSGRPPAAALAAAPPADSAPKLALPPFVVNLIRFVPGGEFTVGFLLILGVVGGLAAIIWRPWPASSSSGPVATAERTTEVGSLAHQTRAQWSHSPPMPSGAGVRPGQYYEIASGTVETVLARGTRVVVEGPARWQFTSAQRMTLEHGRLVASVPWRAIGFTVVTPSAEVVDLGTEFGVEVDEPGKTDVQVLRGRVEVTPSSAPGEPQPHGQRVVAGQAVRIFADRRAPARIAFNHDRFKTLDSAVATTGFGNARSAQPFPERQPIWLGNLFDDGPNTQLMDAIRTDTFRAGADLGDLGVEYITYGGSPVQEIAPRLRFDLTNLGWGVGESRLQAANDAWSTVEVGSEGLAGGIRLEGKALGKCEPKIEEGIGLVANALLTFNLDSIRAAGGLENRAMEFVCDAAGVNDTAMTPGAPTNQLGGSIHLVAIVSNRSEVLSAVVDGATAEALKQDGCWSIPAGAGEPLRTYGPYISVRQSIPADANYLTLITTGAGNNHWDDHGVWVGARLELLPRAARGNDSK